MDSEKVGTRMNREQELVNIIFEVALTMKNGFFTDKTNEETATCVWF